MATLKIKTLAELETLRREPVDAETYVAAVDIVERVRTGGRPVLLAEAMRLGDITPGQPVSYDRDALESAVESLDAEGREVLERTALRIETFAQGQRDQLLDLEMEIPGGKAGHTFAPVDSAGCYAPGGRFSLPSSVLMTAVTARVAGVTRVLVASPKPTALTLAAAGIAGADSLLAIGGAQVISAMAFGVEGVPACDVIVGPGNRWVTAAKRYVSGYVGIDMLAGPSELVVCGDRNADANVVAADLIAQAEHDTDALPVLVTTSYKLISQVNIALKEQLESLPGRVTAEAALASGFAVLVESIEEAAQACNRLAPEHPAPAASDDCLTVLKWLADGGEGAGLSLDSSRSALAGDSAGGHLTLVTAIAARDAGIPIAVQVPLCPVTDCRLGPQRRGTSL